jgi:hypothetical protein
MMIRMQFSKDMKRGIIERLNKMKKIIKPVKIITVTPIKIIIEVILYNYPKNH